MKKERIAYLLNAYASGRATDTERRELMDWILEAEDDELIKRVILQSWNQDSTHESEYSYVDWNEIYEYIVNNGVKEMRPVRSAERKTRKLYRIAVAASVLLLLSLTTYLLFFIPSQDQTPREAQLSLRDIAPPEEDRAVLILSDGSRIVMDSVSQGIIATQGDVSIIKNDDGAISYSGRGGNGTFYNTFIVPRGSRPLNLTLADGSKIWINVGSSFTFPAAFVGSSREVTVTGEAYFEVAHIDDLPFIVRGNDVNVKVLGTHFNVRVYDDESSDEITLLQGSVQVEKHNVSRLLMPGQQAGIERSEDIIGVKNDIDLENVMAWMDGKFRFNENMNMEDIMREISRWYDVDVDYRGKVSQRFWGSISKDVKISQVLKILEATGGVKFEIDGKRIIVYEVAGRKTNRS